MPLPDCSIPFAEVGMQSRTHFLEERSPLTSAAFPKSDDCRNIQSGPESHRNLAGREDAFSYRSASLLRPKGGAPNIRGSPTCRTSSFRTSGCGIPEEVSEYYLMLKIHWDESGGMLGFRGSRSLSHRGDRRSRAPCMTNHPP